jgi:hypothetical protein
MLGPLYLGVDANAGGTLEGRSLVSRAIDRHLRQFRVADLEGNRLRAFYDLFWELPRRKHRLQEHVLDRRLPGFLFQQGIQVFA